MQIRKALLISNLGANLQPLPCYNEENAENFPASLTVEILVCLIKIYHVEHQNKQSSHLRRLGKWK